MKRRPQRRDQPLGVSKRPKAHNTPSEPGYGPATSQTESRLANIDEFDFITQSDQSRADSSLNVSIDDLTMPEQEDRYREWRKSGSINDEWCFTCHVEGDVLSCHTCRRSYHPRCLPASNESCETEDGWFCPKCVIRNWHIRPPSLTPPSTPPPQSARTVLTPSSEPVALDTISVADVQSHTRNERSMPLVRSGDGRDSNIEIHESGERDIMRRTPGPVKGRRSKFSTLETDVESALSILYRELEFSNSLQQEVRGLRKDLQASQQELQILRNQMTILEAEAVAARASLAEITRLRTELSDFPRINEESQTLKQENEKLRTEIDQMKSAMTEKDAVLESWKAKLKGLLED